VRGRAGTEKALRTAFGGEPVTEDAELRLLYQPVIDLTTGRLDRFEALLRWNRPGHGLLTPADFLTVAEETGLIRPIGDWVFAAVCRQLAEWSAAGHPEATVAVNLSAAQLGPGVVRDITDHITGAGIRPGQLEVELTEHLLREGAGAATVVRDLRAAGVSVTLDDFGTGHSSLGYLQTLSLDAIKLDRAFIATLDPARPSGPAAAILRAVTEMARALGLRVTAEGVEEPHQLALVRAAGCHTAQGHLFARPMEAGEATALLTGHPPWEFRPDGRPRVLAAEGAED
jgi:EAL domain-containing protein (putative c-di-GMP-specific phosphodiesterase class I)